MENEVIINGCNVAECEFFQSEYLEDDSVFCEFCTIWYNACLNNPDCYFKQLQRLKDKSEKIDHRFKETKKANKQYKIDIKNLQDENTQLKEWLENKEKACNHLRDVNARKKEQIKNLNYMLFEEKEMTTKEWKLKYRLANKERKFIQYKEITNNKLNSYKRAFEDIIKYCNIYSKTEDYVIDQTFNEFLENVFNKINEILK